MFLPCESCVRQECPTSFDRGLRPAGRVVRSTQKDLAGLAFLRRMLCQGCRRFRVGLFDEMV